MGWAPDYATVEEIRAYRQIEDVEDDVELALAVTAASRSIDRFANRQFGQVDVVEARRYTAFYERRHCRWVVPVDDLMDAAGLTVEFDSSGDLTFATSITAAEVDLWEPNAVSEGEPWTRLVVLPAASASPDSQAGSTRVTGLWGWAAVPDVVKQATLIQAMRLVSRRLAQSQSFGGDVEPVASPPSTRLDPDVRVMLGKYRRHWGMVS